MRKNWWQNCLLAKNFCGYKPYIKLFTHNFNLYNIHLLVELKYRVSALVVDCTDIYLQLEDILLSFFLQIVEKVPLLLQVLLFFLFSKNIDWERLFVKCNFCRGGIYIYVGNVSCGNHTLRENSCKPWQNSRLNSQKNHICRWYDDTQPCKISYPKSTSFVRYKNNKFQVRKVFKWFVRNLLFLYLTNKVEFG
jgi:hypothetical protein